MRPRRLLLCALGITVGLLWLATTPVFASKIHIFRSSFGGSGSSPGKFEEPIGVAVSEVGGSAGDVYVADRNNNRVQIFNATGTTVLGEFNGAAAPTGPLRHPEWIAVDNSTNPLDPSAGDVYVTDVTNGHEVVYKFSASGTYEGQIDTGAQGNALGKLEGLAVDSEGRVWLDQESLEIDDYSDALNNEFIASRQAPFAAVPPGFAVDGEDNLYVNRGSDEITKLSSSGEELYKPSEEQSSAAAVDVSNNHVYLDNLKSVAEFDAAGTLIEQFGAGHLSEGSGVAVNSTSHTVYVVDRVADTVNIFPEVALPIVSTTAATAMQRDGSVTLNGAVNPDGESVSSCVFEYGTETSYGNSVPCEQSPAEIGSGTTAVSVSAHVVGLAEGTRYHYRLLVANDGGESAGQDEKFTIPAALAIEGQSENASNIGASIATLSARINPGGLLATYRVEYGVSAQYGSSTPYVSIGSGLQFAAVQVQLEGLQPNATYHYRFLATSEAGTVVGSDATFTTTVVATAIPPVLPDNRAYELLSSPTEDKNMYDPTVSGDESLADIQTEMPFRSASDGEAVTYPGEPANEGGNGSVGGGNGNQYIARRGPDGWSADDVTPVGSNLEAEYVFFSSDLSIGALVSRAAVTEPGGGCLYLATLSDRGSQGESLGRMTPAVNTCELPVFSGSSTTGEHLLFAGQGALVPGAKMGGEEFEDNLYDVVDGQLHMVNILPDGQPQSIARAAFGGVPFFTEQHPDLGNAISADGSRVFWSSEGPKTGRRSFPPLALYVRENDAQPQSPLSPDDECTVESDACTVQVDAGEPQCVAETKCTSGGGIFWGASSDGSRVFFTDCAKLTSNSTAVPGECIDEESGQGVEGTFRGQDLYEYDVNTKQVSDITLDHNSSDPLGADVQGVLGVSEDGSYVYFVAGGVLASGASPRNCTQISVSEEAREREDREEELGLLPPHRGCNLYVLHDGTTKFIGSLLIADNNLGRVTGTAANRGDWRGGLGERSAEVTPDGQSLIFTSTRRLTGYDSEGLREAFVYDAGTGDLVCASCNPSGAPPVGDPSQFNSEQGGYLPVDSKPTYMDRYISADGSRVFFETIQPLSPRDTNGVQDVYEWERNDSGSCPAVEAGGDESGCIFLLSGGESPDAAYIVDSDSTGQNVFFTSRGELVPQARDETVAVYDARVDGGFFNPSLSCSGTGCQGVPAAPPIFATPSSATFNGVGNFVAESKKAVKSSPKSKQCRRGFVRNHGKCVARVKRKARKRVKRASRRSGRKG